jgi:ubiquinone/menaquinone biosynthesis C-methylase UbiE
MLTSKGRIGRYFAGKYAELANAIESREEYKRLAEKVVERVKEGRVLELGSGPGYLAIELAKLGNFEITGLDTSDTMISIAEENAREEGVEVEFRLGDAAHVPFDDGTFDFIMSRRVLHYWKQPRVIRIFNEVHRTLKTNGRALMVELRPDASKEAIDKEVRKLNDSFIARWGLRWGITRSIKRAHTQNEIHQLLSETEFRKCEVQESPLELEIWLEK